LGLLANGHSLGTSCVNVAEVEHGLRPKERKAAAALLDRLDFLETTREAARRAGRYQADFRRLVEPSTLLMPWSPGQRVSTEPLL
jgi:predicted nucleic acid-binding protein